MINICVVKIAKKYGPEYVNRLYNMIKRNSTVDFTIHCYTEDSTGIIPEVNIVPIPDSELNSNKKLQWHKVSFYKKGFANIPEGEEIIIMDIDMIMMQNIDEMLTYPCKDNEFVGIHRWWTQTAKGYTINGGWQKFRSGKLECILNDFEERIDFWQEYYIKNGFTEGPVNGEQNFVEDAVNKNNITLTLMPSGWVGKHEQHLEGTEYDRKSRRKLNTLYCLATGNDFFFLGNEFHEDVKIVHFAHSLNGMHLVEDDWISDYWY